MDNQPVSILRISDVTRRTGLSRSSIYKAVQEQRFPAPIKLIGKTTGWLESEVSDWVQDRIAESRPSQAAGNK